MTRAICVAFHKYTPFGDEFYEPLLDFFLQQIKKYEDEFDRLYIVDSNWNIDPLKLVDIQSTVIKVNPHLRYYDAYKEILPQIKEDLVLFMDNDMVVYKHWRIDTTFNILDTSKTNWFLNGKKVSADVVSIYDTIGEKTFTKLNGKSKFCPYWFATRKELLMKYLDVDWGSNMPQYETLGKLTEVMLNDGIKPYEWEEDKTNILFDGTQDGEKGKDLGYYHIRAGSTPAYLLATRKEGSMDTYWEYIRNQPKNEYLRQLAWYWYMCSETKNMEIDLTPILRDALVPVQLFVTYMENFKLYHGLV